MSGEQNALPEWAREMADAIPINGDGYPDEQDMLAIARALVEAEKRGRTAQRDHFIEWIRPWVKKRFGVWITHNTAKGAYQQFTEAKP